MNCKNRMLSITAATALLAAATVPALALENEFHGSFKAQFVDSNFNRVNGNGVGDYDFGTTKNRYSANYVEQRARLQYTAKANADLRLVTQFELDYAYWGNSSYTVGRNSGGALGADSVNLETKHIYLDAAPYKGVNLRLGMMPNNDAFKAILFDADMAGVLASSSYGKFSPSIGYFRFNDGSTSVDKALGKKTSDMFMFDAKYEVSKELKVGGAYYFFGDGLVSGSSTTPSNPPSGVLADGTSIYPVGTTFTTATTTNDIKIHALGLNAEYAEGPLTLNGFAVYETGWNNKRYTSAFAGNVGARLKTGPGTARAEFLYVTGDGGGTGRSNAFYAVDGEHGYYDNEMVILGRDKNVCSADTSLIYNAGNKGQGQVGGYLGYDLPVTDRLATAFNAGFAAVAKENAAKPVNLKTGAVNKSNYIGTEINAEANYKLMDNLKASVRVGYVMLGDYYKDVTIGGTPANPYDAKLMFKYTF